MKANARKIHRVAIADSPELLRNALQNSGIQMDDIDHIIPHQTSERSIMSGVKKLSEYFGKAPKNVVINLKDYGNTASTTVFLALYRYLKDGLIKKGERIMLICYASGLVVGVIILRMDGLVEIYGK
jgi:3-oxoacyl-[acyl-carrier-protein] synthase-3